MIERLVPELRRVLGDDLLSVWLYGSRARGEDPHSDSDIDLLVVAEGGRERWSRTVHEIAYSVAVDERTSPAFLSIAVYDPEYLAERRRIESFFIQEVDRDKIVLAGRP